jgi:rhombotail lipoprotein
VVLLGLSGCAISTGYNRGDLESRIHENAEKVVDEDIKEITALKPQLRFPCRIAVALTTTGQSECRWTPKDRQCMELWARSLRQEGIATDVVFMSNMFLKSATLREMRATAARYGADALLVVKGTAASTSRTNALALLNLTVLGGYVVPGSRCDALYLLEGGLVDVNNGFLYAAMETEGEGSMLAPTFIMEEKDAIEQAKQEALDAFGPELLMRMRNLRASSCGGGGTAKAASAPTSSSSGSGIDTNMKQVNSPKSDHD